MFKGRHTEETRRKMSETAKGRVLSEEHRRKLSEANRGQKNPFYGKTHENHPFLGKRHTEETRRKLSEAARGRNPWNKGKSPSKETRRKISEANRGKKSWIIGKTHSEEARRRLSVAHLTSERVAESRQRRFKEHASFPERLVRARLEAAVVHFIHQGRLPGSRHPYDFVLPEKRTIIEVDGCHFHSCPLHRPLNPGAVAKWYRDAAHELHAIGQGFRVIRLWEHDVLAPKRQVLVKSEILLRLLRKKRWRTDLKRADKFSYLNLDEVIPAFLGGRLD